MITKYGLSIVVSFFLIAFISVVCVYLVTDSKLVRILIVSVFSLLGIFVLNFFRDPERVTPRETGAVISPADGKIVLIKDLYESEYLKLDAVQVSIFMSPLDVHVNRFPITGNVGFFKHIEGEYIVAFDDKSSERNERTLIGMEDNGFKILFKQIAGTVARRIIADLSVGQSGKAGERFGMIRFGSRVDVILPKGTLITVKLNDVVRAGETIIARRDTNAGGIGL